MSPTCVCTTGRRSSLREMEVRRRVERMQDDEDSSSDDGNDEGALALPSSLQ